MLVFLKIILLFDTPDMPGGLTRHRATHNNTGRQYSTTQRLMTLYNTQHSTTQAVSTAQRSDLSNTLLHTPRPNTYLCVFVVGWSMPFGVSGLLLLLNTGQPTL